MSTLTVSNVSDGSLSIPTTYVTNGSAKAWVNFNGTGTIAARDSLNVSSLTDVGTGQYTINFTNSFGAADYVCNVTADATFNGTVCSIGHNDADNTGIQTGSVRIVCVGGDGGGIVRDTVITLASILGDLA